ncbi:MAG: PAS domain S-box protein [Candidatus Helarchaeota archaeon]
MGEIIASTLNPLEKREEDGWRNMVMEKQAVDPQLLITSITEQTIMGILIFQDGLIKYVNEACSKIFEYSREEILSLTSKEILNFVYPDDRIQTLKRLREREKGKDNLDLPYFCRIITKSKKVKWIEIYSKIIKYETRQAIFLNFLDITERKQAQDLMREQRDLALRLDNAKSLDEKFRLCLEAAFKVSGMDCGGVYIFDEISGCLDLVYHAGLSSAFVAAVSHYEINSPNSKIMLKGRPIYTQYEKIMVQRDERQIEEGLRAIAIIPLLHEDEIIGALNVSSHEIETITLSARTALETIGLQIGNALARSKTEKALRLSEEKYRDLIENLNEVIYSCDLNGKITYVSPIIKKLLGYESSEIIGKSFTKFLHLTDSSTAEKTFQRIKEGKVKSFDFRMNTSSNEVRWVQSINRRLLKNGEVIGVHGSLTDITEQKKAEQELKESETKYRLITENANDLIALIDLDFRLKYVNTAHVRLLGYSMDKLLKNKATSFIHPDDLHFAVEAFRKGLEVGHGKVELRIRHENGKYLWFEVRGIQYEGAGDEKVALLISRDISERKSAEQRTKESEERFKTLFNSANDAIFVHELRDDGNRGIFVEINDVACKRYGYTREEFLKMTPSDIDAPEMMDKIQDIMGDLLIHGENTFEMEHVLKNGSRLPVEINSHLVELKDKIFVLSIVRDITERKRAERELKESEEKYRELVENLHEIIYSHDENQVITYISPAIERIFGYKPSEVIGKKISDFIVPEDVPKGIKHLKKMLKGIISPFEFRVKTKSGKICWVESFYSIIRKEGRFVGVHGTLLDITERKHAEEKLQESEEKFHALFEKSPTGIGIMDMNGKILDLNPAAQKIIGQEKEQIIGKLFREIGVVSKETLQKLQENISRVIKGEKSKPIEFAVNRKDGAFVWVNANGSLVNFAGKKFFQFILQDISDRKKTELKLAESEEKYRIISEAADDLIIIFNNKFEFEYINEETFKRVLGYFDVDLLGKSALSVVHPGEVEDIRVSFQKVFEIGDLTISSRVKHKDGYYIWIESKGKTFTDKSGKTKLLVISRDITEKMNAQQKIRESEAKFRMIAEQSIMGISIIQDGIVKYANKALEQITEYSFEDVSKWSANSFLNLIHPEDRMIALENLKKMFLKDPTIPIQYTYRMITKSNVNKWVNVFSKIIQFEGKDSLFSFFMDITDQKQAELALQASEERWRSLVENAPVMICTLDSKGTILQINRSEVSFERIGVKPEEFLGRKIYTYIEPKYREEVKSVLDSVFKNGEKARFRTASQNADGELRWYLNSIAPIKQEGNVVAAIFIAIDVTDQKQAEDALKYRLDLEEFISRVSTEFINLPIEEIDEGINNALKVLTLYLNSKYCAILTFPKDNPEIGIKSYEYMVNEDDLSYIPLNEIKIDDFPYLSTMLRSQAFIIIRSLADVPADATGANDWLKKYGFRPVLLIPMVHKGTLFGTLIFSGDFGEKKEWLEKDVLLLKYVADIFVNAIERKRAELKLKESEERYRYLFEQSTLGIVITDRNKNILEMNSACEQIFRVKKEKIIGPFENAISLLPKNMIPRIKDRFETIVQGARIDPFEFSLKLKTGDTVWVKVQSTLLKLGEKNYVQHMIEDITSRKMAEEQLRQSEEKYRLISENANDLIAIFDEHGRYEYINEEIYLKILGYKSEDLIGKFGGDFIHPVQINRIKFGNQSEFLAKMGDEPREYLARHKDGHYIWLEIKGKQFKDKDGKIKGLYLARDISERKALEEARKNYMEDLEKEVELKTKELKNEAKKLENTLLELKNTQEMLVQSEKLASIGLLAAGVAHEINNPLMGIINYAEIVKEELKELSRLDLEVKPFSFLTQIIEEGKRISKIVADLLSFARRDPGIFRIESILKPINASLSLLQPKLRKSKIEVTLDVPDDLPFIPLKVQEIQQVFINILQNSIDAIDERFVDEKLEEDRKITIKASLSKKKNTKYVRISFTDNGIGIKKKDLSKVFDPFFTTKKGKSIPGTGLGLSISYGIIRAHSGKINIESKRKKSTTVSVFLPLKNENNKLFKEEL